MKSYLTILFCLITIASFGQSKQDASESTRIWYNSKWEVTNSQNDRKYYCIKEKEDQDGRYIATYYEADGTKLRKVSEINKVRDGSCIYYWESGEKYKEVFYTNDKLDGDTKIYTETGKITYFKKYEMGTLIEKIAYDTITGEGTAIDKSIFQTPDTDASFVGGLSEMVKFIHETCVYPENSRNLGEQDKVYVSFVIEKNGKISNVEILKGSYDNLNEEAMRVVSSMPDWIPGTTEGEIVKTRVRLPINFVLEGDKKSKKSKKRR